MSPAAIRWRSSATLLALFALATACAEGETAPRGPGSVAGWPAYGGSPGGGHYSSATQITKENVHQLELAWEHRSGDIREARSWDHADGPFPQSGFQTTPILIDETLYYCSPFNQVFALDAESGTEKWRFDPGIDKYAHLLPNCRGVSSWRSGKAGACEHRIFVGTLDARLIALDAQTGRRCMDFGDSGEVDVTHRISQHHPIEYSITSPPAILNDLAITGSLVLDNQRTDAPSGVVRAYDVRSGALRWAWNPIPKGMEPLNEDGTFRSGTTNVWSIISVDEERNLVFIPTGNTSPDYFGGHRKDLDHYSSSVVALDGETGEVVWHYQMVHHDLWDYDTPAQPTLMDLRIDGETIPAVVQVTKMGMTFVLHRETGEPIWPIEERPVPQGPVAGEYLSPTQPFPTHVPHLLAPLTEEDAWGFTFWDEGECRDRFKEVRNDGFYTPPSLGGSILYPSNGGGNNWGSPAIHPREQVMVVLTWRVAGTTTLTPREKCGEENTQQQIGTPYCVDTGVLMSPFYAPCTEPPWGTLDAVDIAAGEIRWSVPLGTSRDIAPFPMWWIKGVPGTGGPSLTSTGLIFVGGALERAFRAYDLSTGEELWQTRLPTGANSIPMTYQLRENGRQFVVVAVGGHWGDFSNPPGDHLMAFALPH